MHDYARLYDIELVEVIEDAGFSGKNLRRPGLQRALAMLEAGQADALLVAKLDRSTRSVRDLGALIAKYGRGRVAGRGWEIDLQRQAPYVGLALDTIQSLRDLSFPPGGLFLVENFTVFEACCRGEVRDGHDALIVWTAGFPRCAVRLLVERAAALAVRVRLWSDLDLAGVQIARLVESWAPGVFAAHRMSRADVDRAPVRRPLEPARLAALRRDLTDHPDRSLHSTVAKLVEQGVWVEQECFLIPGDE